VNACRWEYLAFLGGPRTCIGQQFALTQMAYVFTRLLQTFEAVEPRDDRPMLHRAGVSNSLANGCYISFKPA
jgi:cytochrome P450